MEEAYHKYVDRQGKHHNPFFQAGSPSLKKAMLKNHSQFPSKRFTVKNVLGDGAFVVAHSHMVPSPEEKGLEAVILFRFQGIKIIEMWDSFQPMPTDSLNRDGIF